MTIPEIKAAQEKALGEFAYYSGLLSFAGGVEYENEEPRVEFRDNQDFARMDQLWWDKFTDGYAEGRKVSETVQT